MSDHEPDEFDLWWAANAKCSSCVFFERGIIGDIGRCDNTNPRVDFGIVSASNVECGEGYEPDQRHKNELDVILGRLLNAWSL